MRVEDLRLGSRTGHPESAIPSNEEVPAVLLERDQPLLTEYVINTFTHTLVKTVYYIRLVISLVGSYKGPGQLWVPLPPLVSRPLHPPVECKDGWWHRLLYILKTHTPRSPLPDLESRIGSKWQETAPFISGEDKNRRHINFTFQELSGTLLYLNPTDNWERRKRRRRRSEFPYPGPPVLIRWTHPHSGLCLIS